VEGGGPYSEATSTEKGLGGVEEKGEENVGSFLPVLPRKV